MNKIRCATFDKDMQDSVPKEVREKMIANRLQAEKERLIEYRSVIQHFIDWLIDSEPEFKLCNLYDHMNNYVDCLQRSRDEVSRSQNKTE